MTGEPDRDALRTKVFGERTLYDSTWIRLGLVDIQTPDGRRFEHHRVHLPSVAIALLVDDQQRVLMLWRHRFAADRWGYEFVGGLVEPGEDPAGCAAREAEEESGWRPLGAPRHLATFDVLPGTIEAQVDLFYWREFEHIGDPTDMAEAGELRWVPLAELRTLMATGSLLGAATWVGALTLLAR